MHANFHVYLIIIKNIKRFTLEFKCLNKQCNLYYIGFRYVISDNKQALEINSHVDSIHTFKWICNVIYIYIYVLK